MESNEHIRVVLVDDHDIYRGGLRGLLEEQGVEIVGEAATGEQAIELVQQSAPDVVVMDVNMPGMGGIEATRRIATVSPASRVLMLTISSDQPDVTDAIIAGAQGYLLKSATTQEIVSGIASAASGESLLSPSIASQLLDRVRERPAEEQAHTEHGVPAVELSEREIEVLKLLAGGLDNAEIGERLYISPSTVKNHISSILVKLQIENRIQAAVYAVRSGLV